MNASTHSPEEWYALAERAYVEKHQGCVWCGGSHRVFCTKKGTTQLYFCQACDCRCSFQSDSGKFQFVPGENIREQGPETMSGDGQPLSH